MHFVSASTHPLVSGLMRSVVKEAKDEKRLSAPILKQPSLRKFLGTQEFAFSSGTRTGVATNGASSMIFSLPTGPVLSATLSSTIVPEITAFSSIFDEVKVAGIRWAYNPTNPFNRGATTVSVPIALFWDDEALLTPTNTNTVMGGLSNRFPLYHSFSPDIPHNHHFMRPTTLTQYDWTPLSNLGSESSTLGGLHVVGDGTNTASITYGYMEFQFLLVFRVRV